MLAIGSGSGRTATSGPSARGSRGSATFAPVVSGGPVKIENTAYIVKRVKAKIAQDSLGSTVIHSYVYSSGDVTSNGSVANLGKQTSSGYEYTAPDGAVYQRNTAGDITGIGVTDPAVNGQRNISLTVINHANDTYSVRPRYSVTADGNSPEGPSLTVAISSSKVLQALQSGQLIKMGTTTVNGRKATALSVKLKQRSGVTPVRVTLYVDARSYQPLREVVSTAANEGPYVADWLPATPGNVAKAKDASIPTGYTKVDNAR